VRRTTSETDFAARHDGGAFTVVLPQITPTYLRSVANQIRSAIESEEVEHAGRSLRATVSMGAVCVSRTNGTHDAEMLIKVADKLLHHAKEGGGNRVETFSRSSLVPPSEEAA
jgi:diguanylate cyclase (GGDEF)-like protein